jgi:hypothetical protein
MLLGAAAKGLARKYDASSKIPDAPASSGVSLINAVLFAAIPVALTFGFYGGRRSRTAKVTTLHMPIPQQEQLQDDAVATDPLMPFDA